MRLSELNGGGFIIDSDQTVGKFARCKSSQGRTTARMST
jgi:hypothetical protein